MTKLPVTMFSGLFGSLRARADLKARIEALEEGFEQLEGRMDTDEARRSEWVGTVKRTLARINRAAQREESGVTEERSNGHAVEGTDYAEAQRLGLFR